MCQLVIRSFFSAVVFDDIRGHNTVDRGLVMSRQQAGDDLTRQSQKKKILPRNLFRSVFAEVLMPLKIATLKTVTQYPLTFLSTFHFPLRDT